MIKKSVAVFTAFVLMMANLVISPVYAEGSSGAENSSGVENSSSVFERMRIRRLESLVGGDYDPNDPEIKQKIASLTNAAQTKWDSMIKAENRTRLWEEYDLSPAASGIDMQTTFQSMRSLATAYQLKGSTLYKNPQLKQDIVNALVFLNKNVYNTGVNYVNNGSIGWYYWELGSPLSIIDCLVLMHEDITQQLIDDYVAAIQHFSPDIHKMNFGGSPSTGANLSWRCTVAIVSGILTENADMITEAVEAMGDLFHYADDYDLDDGFYRDGSFIQHRAVSYNGAYGTSAFGQVVDLIFLLNDSPFAGSHPEKDNVYDWAFNAFAPLLYNGSMMDMTRGRTITRASATDRSVGREVLRALFKLSLIASEDNKIKLQRIIKQNVMINEEETQKFITGLPISFIKEAKAMLYGDQVPKVPFNEMTKVFAGMDRAVYRNENFGFGISMFSERQHSYEITDVSVENKRGFYTGFGATYLYNKDFMHYSNAYWPTVNPYLLAGTTVTDTPLPDGYGANRYSTKAWVGGVTLEDRYGAVGMGLEDYKTMTAKKSWFMFDNQIVALGADINNEDPAPFVRTVVENRIVDENNKITVDGLEKDFGEEYDFHGPRYMHIEGEKTNIGYYFPTQADVKVFSGERTGTWQEISNMSNPTELQKRPYATITIEHGKAPRGAEYAYVLLPERTTQQVADYAENPTVEIVENSAQAAAVRDKKLNLLGINFWGSEKHRVDTVTSSGMASVMLQDQKGILKLAISDPTQKGNQIELEIDKQVQKVESVDSRIEVVQTSPTLKLKVDVSGAKGRGINGVFELEGYDPNKVEDTSSIQEIPKDMVVLKVGDYRVYFNSKLSPINKVNMSVAPISINERILVPVRFAVNALGMSAEWDNAASMVHLFFKDDSARFKMGSDEAVVNNIPVGTDSPATMVDNNVYVPLRIIAEKVLHKKVAYFEGMVFIGDERMNIDRQMIEYFNKIFENNEGGQ